MSHAPALVPDSRLRGVARALQFALAVIVLYALVTLQAGLLVNSVLPLAVALVPAAVARRRHRLLSPVLSLWIAVAATLHAVGALGPYSTVGWYDKVAHAVSSALVAGVGYAVVQAIDSEDDAIHVPPRLRSVFVVVFVLAFGVLWEIAEFAAEGLAATVGGQAVLAQYGLSDVVLDLLFNAVGAVLVAAWGTDHFDGLATLLAQRVRWIDRGS